VDSESSVSFPARIRDLFIAPGRLGDTLREHPRWFIATLLGACLLGVGTVLVPPDIWESMLREQLLSSGQSLPEGGVASGRTIQIGAALASFVTWFIVAAISAGLYTLLFGFILGDEVSYRQSIAIVGHAGVITAIGSLSVVPIRIARQDPQVTLSLGTFVEGALDPGFLLYFLQGLDLFALWAWVVTAILFSRMDRQRSTGTALATVFLVSAGLVAVLSLVRAVT